MTGGELADEAARDAGTATFHVRLTEADYRAIEVGIDHLIQTFRDAGKVFGWLSYHTEGGRLDPEDTVIPAVMRLSARALRSKQDKELAALDRLDKALRLAERTPPAAPLPPEAFLRGRGPGDKGRGKA